MPLGDRKVGILKVVSGGQTGVDRAALDVALELGIPCGGWCPKGRRAEDGAIAPSYPLSETSSSAYPERTARNIRDSDGTLVLTRGVPDGGTALTVKLANRYRRPLLSIDLEQPSSPDQVASWAERQGVEVLNVAGPRESSCPGITDEAGGFLRRALALAAR
jgi:hypothetical protein